MIATSAPSMVGPMAEALRGSRSTRPKASDMLMVQAGMPLSRPVHRVRAKFGVPTFAYQVSGEYSMLTAPIERGWLERSEPRPS